MVDILRKPRRSRRFRYDSYLNRLREVQQNARASRSSRVFAALIRNTDEALTTLPSVTGARRLVYLVKYKLRR